MPNSNAAVKHTPHFHVYAQHPKWPTHAYCRICGFAVIKSALPSDVRDTIAAEVQS